MKYYTKFIPLYTSLTSDYFLQSKYTMFVHFMVTPNFLFYLLSVQISSCQMQKLMLNCHECFHLLLSLQELERLAAQLEEEKKSIERAAKNLREEKTTAEQCVFI